MCAVEALFDITYCETGLNECLALVAGTADYCSIKTTGIADKMCACQEAAHAVTEYDLRKLGVIFFHCKAKNFHVVNHMPPTVFF